MDGRSLGHVVKTVATSFLVSLCLFFYGEYKGPLSLKMPLMLLNFGNSFLAVSSPMFANKLSEMSSDVSLFSWYVRIMFYDVQSDFVKFVMLSDSGENLSDFHAFFVEV